MAESLSPDPGCSLAAPRGQRSSGAGFKSIRWTLQLWHAGLLAVVLTAFGSMSYVGISRMRYQEVDTDLERSVQGLVVGLRPKMPGRPTGEGPPGVPPMDPRPTWPEGDTGPRPEPPDWRGPGPLERPVGRPPDGPHARERSFPPWLEFEAPVELDRRAATGELYYVIWGFDGRVLKSSANAGEVPDPGSTLSSPPKPGPPQIRQRGEVREAYVYGPFGLRGLVGRSMRPDQAALHRLAFLLVAVGAGVLVIGLAGGWLVSLRAVRPIEAITAVAQEISASNLSRRIDLAGTQSELGTLAAVLNDTFARLEAAFQQQVRFTADASHELRTPLAVIHTHAQLALSRQRSAEEYRRMFETCLRASDRMKNLVDSLLLLARADAGRLSLNRTELDLRDLVAECVEMVSPLAAKKGVTVESDLESVTLLADGTRVAQVATNLLTNAIRYNREGGRVQVHVGASGSDALLSVTDTGVGIPAESQPHLFERFYRVDAARNREEGGSGLGLAICKSIAEAHGGTITFCSEAGKGAVFLVRLPRGGADGGCPADSLPTENGPSACG